MRRKEKAKRVRLIKMAAAALAGVVLVFCFPAIAPLAEEFIGQIAIFTTAITLPEGAAITLQERFAPEIYAPDGLFPESQSPAPDRQSSQSSSQGASKPPSVHVPGFDGEVLPYDIPEEYRGVLEEVFFDGEDSSSFYQYDGGWIRNYTKLGPAEIEEVLATDFQGKLTPSEKPQILIYHTHATESYELFDSPWYDIRNSWRSTDNNNNVVEVGEALKKALENQGFMVIHDTTQHDYPSYNGSYERSRATVEALLKKYPTVTVLLDVHRDAILRDDNSIAKPVVEIDGIKAAQIMIAAGCDDGSMGVPGWRDNFRLAAALEAEAQRQVPGLMRPVFFAYRNYNQDLSPQTLLLEMGSNGNTLDEAVYAAELFAPILWEVLKGS